MSGSFIGGVSRNLSFFTSLGSGVPKHVGLVGNRKLSISCAMMGTKSKFPGTGSGGNGIVDPDVYSLDLDEKGQQKLEKFKKIIEISYYEKYKAKIVEKQKSSPKSFLSIIEQIVCAGKKATALEPEPSRTALDEIMKLEMFQKYVPHSVIPYHPLLACGVFSRRPIEYYPFASPRVTNVMGGIRFVTMYSIQKGKRKTVKAVIRRFYRLYWGAWIRTKAGKHRKVWRKNYYMRKRALQHVFCNNTQNYLFDRMVCKYWREKKHYVDDPYESYHTRDNFLNTRKWSG